MKTTMVVGNIPPSAAVRTTQGCPETWRNRRGQVVALSHETVKTFASQAEAEAWLRAGGKRQQPKKRVESSYRKEVRKMRKMAAVNTQTGQVETLSPEVQRKIEAQLNAKGDLEGLVAFSNEAGEVRFAAAVVPHWKERKPRGDAEYQKWYAERLGQEQGH